MNDTIDEGCLTANVGESISRNYESLRELSADMEEAADALQRGMSALMQWKVSHSKDVLGADPRLPLAVFRENMDMEEYDTLTGVFGECWGLHLIVMDLFDSAKDIYDMAHRLSATLSGKGQEPNIQVPDTDPLAT